MAVRLISLNCCDLSWIKQESSFWILGSERRAGAAISVSERRVSIEQPKNVGFPFDSAGMSE